MLGVLLPMDEDYYKTLGVSRTATAEEIHKAYRSLARKYHPDLNPNDKKAQDKFKKVQLAYDVLQDPEKRKKYDQFGHAFEQYASAGGQGASFNDMDFSQFFGGAGSNTGNVPSGFEELFRQFTGGAGQAPQGRRGKRRGPNRGSDVEAEIQIPFNLSIVGGSWDIRLTRPQGHLETISVRIPAGIESGKHLRVRGKGESAPQPDGPDGDLVLTVYVASHPCYSRQGLDLEVTVPVSFSEAALGTKVDIPTPRGTIAMSIPAGTSSGKRLRMRGHGVKLASGETGDLYAEIQIVLPGPYSETETESIRKLEAAHPFEPRKGLMW
jgi:DnaJ-class molecular chaperone